MTRSRAAGGWRRAARVIAWNVLPLLAGLALFAGGFETWLRLTRPFEENAISWDFHPRAGAGLEPNSEVRFTNGLDFWTVTRINSLGFPDREPIDGKRAAESCHVAVIGDSIVEALQVSIDEKLHVQLEEIAAENLPDLDVTASAWGLMGTGQIAQTAYYDEFVRRMNPNLLVLVFVPNDFIDNTPLFNSLTTGYDPDRLPQRSAERDENRIMVLRPPDSEAYLHRLAPAPIESRAPQTSQIEILARRPRYATILAGETNIPEGWSWFEFSLLRNLSPRLLEYALEFTAFGLEQFKERADEDGVRLIILSTYWMRQDRGNPAFPILSAMAEEHGIPVIDQYEYALRQRMDISDLNWDHDAHWNSTGHRIAAEALVEWLADNRHVCGDVDEFSS